MGTLWRAFLVILFLLKSSLAASDGAGKVDFDLSDVMAFAGMLGVSEESMLHDSSVTFHKETQLLYTIAQKYQEKEGHRKKPPPGDGRFALNIDATYAIDHVEPLDEDEETMTAHGSVTLKWTDPLYTWQPDKFDNIKLISRSFNEYITSFRPWTPSVYFKTADPGESRKQESGEGYTTILTVKYTGEIIMHKKFSVKSSCDFNYRDFPYDTQRCTIIMSSQHNIKEVWFSDDRNQKKHSARQLKQDRNTPMIGDFILDYIHAFNTIIKADLKPEQLKGPWKDGQPYEGTGKMATVVTLSFTRINDKYFYGFGLPLVACSLIVQATLIFDTKRGFIFLALPLLMITKQIGSISQGFPSDADGTPLLVVMHYMTIIQIVFCFTGLVVLSHIYGPRVGLTMENRKAPENVKMSEATARTLYFILNFFFLIIVAMGSLYYGGWSSWDDDDSSTD